MALDSRRAAGADAVDLIGWRCRGILIPWEPGGGVDDDLGGTGGQQSRHRGGGLDLGRRQRVKSRHKNGRRDLAARQRSDWEPAQRESRRASRRRSSGRESERGRGMTVANLAINVWKALYGKMAGDGSLTGLLSTRKAPGAARTLTTPTRHGAGLPGDLPQASKDALYTFKTGPAAGDAHAAADNEIWMIKGVADDDYETAAEDPLTPADNIASRLMSGSLMGRSHLGRVSALPPPRVRHPPMSRREMVRATTTTAGFTASGTPLYSGATIVPRKGSATSQPPSPEEGRSMRGATGGDQPPRLERRLRVGQRNQHQPVLLALPRLRARSKSSTPRRSEATTGSSPRASATPRSR